MNREALRQASRTLEELLRKYASREPDASLCLQALEPVFDDIRNSREIVPIKDVPGSYYFHEGKLRAYKDLESAYSRFRVLARGLDPNEIEQFIKNL